MIANVLKSSSFAYNFAIQLYDAKDINVTFLMLMEKEFYLYMLDLIIVWVFLMKTWDQSWDQLDQRAQQSKIFVFSPEKGSGTFQNVTVLIKSI
jgi:hypothetical protein